MRIGEALLAEGLIANDQLEKAMEVQRTQKKREPLGETIVKLGFVSSEQMTYFISRYLNFQLIELKAMYKTIPLSLIQLIPEEMALRFMIFPISLIEDTLTLAMYDPLDIIAEDAVRVKTGFKIKRVISFKQDILEAIEYCYHQLPQLKEQIEDFIDQDAQEQATYQTEESQHVEANDPPVVKYVYQLIVQAVNVGASDIHINPKQDSVDLRLRIDSVLCNIDAPPKSMFAAIVTRIKILSDLDIAERRQPQDGRFKMKVGTQDVDVRVSCFPTIYGENVVMRILNTSSPLLGLSQLGMRDDDLTRYQKMIHQPHGLILVTGPTGSGKTTTLYATLSEIQSAEKNMITLEDPVEYRLPFLQQSQVHASIGFNFASGLRSILRQDPDVVMIGEIRDRETAEIAIQASLTGHLVLSTLHTNDAVGAPVRLMNMGVEPFLLASSLIGVFAQRLVRRICPHCKKEYTLSDQAWSSLELPSNSFTPYHGEGCDECFNRGYRGRTALFEVLTINDPIRELITKRASSEDIRNAAREAGMKTLFESGIDKMRDGVTTIDEVLRVTESI